MYEAFRDTIVAEVTAALPLDAVVMGLHGASIAHGYDDVEGDLLARIRAVVGPAVVVAAHIDPHSHLTEQRVAACDIIVAYKEFPHVDQAERAEEVVALTLRAARGEIRPTMAKFDCRMIEVYPTSQQPMRGFADRLMAAEYHSERSALSELPSDHPGGGDPAVLSLSCIHGFMAADVPEMGSQMLAVVDADQAKAAALAKKFGLELFGLRGQTRPTFLTIDQAIDAALAGPKPAVIADVWDNAGGGAAGDSTFILRRLIERGVGGAALAGLWDPMAVQLCAQAGAGSSLQLRFGGKTAVTSGLPIDAEVAVLAVRDGPTQPFSGADISLGQTAALAVPLAGEAGAAGGTVEVVLWTERTQTFHPAAFTNAGVDLTNKSILVVKSTNHFYGGFAKVAGRSPDGQSAIYYVDTGLTHLSPYPSDPTKTNYKKLSRSIWPIVDDPHNIGAEHVPWTRPVEKKGATPAAVRGGHARSRL